MVLVGFFILDFYLSLQEHLGSIGRVLGSGLQNRVRRFESAIDLNLKSDNVDIQCYRFFCLGFLPLIFAVTICCLYFAEHKQ